jgi:hypothetical protein
MAHYVNHMSYGSGMGLSRQLCTSCKTETLHKGPKCVHCSSGEATVVKRAASWREQIERGVDHSRARNCGDGK